MIVSHTHRFIFLKTLKTAGTSVELALARICGEDDIITPLAPADELLRQGRRPQRYLRTTETRAVRPDGHVEPALACDFYNHLPASAALEYLGPEVWRRYFKFAFERNPWDRQVSFFHYRRRGPAETFDEHLNDPLSRIPNFDIYSIYGRVAVDFIGRYETLRGDFRWILRHLGIAHDIPLPRAKSAFRPDAGDYRHYYTPATRERLREWYGREIALCDYEF